jgi:hypothetical protein
MERGDENDVPKQEWLSCRVDFRIDKIHHIGN